MYLIFSNSKLFCGLGHLLHYCISHTSIPLVVIVLAIFIIWRLYLLVKEAQKLPPGPWGPPVVGYLPFVGVKHKTFLELARSYGPLFSARLGNQLTIVLSDYRLIWEAFRSDEITGRPHTPLMHTLEGLGIINSEGELWKNQRKFLQEKLRGFGMSHVNGGKRIMEEKITTEVSELLDAFHETEGSPIDPNSLLALSISNIICGMTMSIRFSHGDPRFQRLNRLIEEGMRLFGQIHYGEYIPLYNYLPGKAEAINMIQKNRSEMFRFYEDLIKEHRDTLDSSNIRDVIDLYLVEIENAKSRGESGKLFEGRDIELQLKQILGDLFSAGMETIKSSILWMMVFMLRNPEVKRKVQQELDTVVGRDRLPSLNDKSSCPYTQGTIYETLRMANIVPLATTHSPTKDVFINGYKIPAGSQVIPLINCVHMDPKLWKNPEEFDPTRFLEIKTDGIITSASVKTPEYFMPFGVGKRMCLGDALARAEIYLFFSSIMHRFDLEAEPGVPLPSLEGIAGATVAPQSFNIKFIPRTSSLSPSPTPDSSHLRHVGAH